MLLLLSSVVIFMWAISVCKVMFFSSSPGKSSTFLIGAGQKSERKRNVLLVVAHPDDESMFFSPTLLFFTAAGQTVHVLCLSTGNADGKGDIRKEEIFRACVILKVLPHNVTVLDDPHLQDGFCNIWDPHYVGQIIGEHIEGRNIDLVVTFDNYGISGHPNHRAVHDGACKFLFQNPGRKIEAWELVSISIFRKYSGPLELWSWSLSNIFTGDRRRSCLVNGHPRKSYLAMAEHSSQWVWYRKLFVLFSSYTYINTLRRISA